ncbi:hypothetical protein NBRC10512_004390 [Rhodotorula toruloides]|uniref:RHTO0S15e03928g1_1 n=2 Tax=Rhodotorula toruloides TaxID=5286 RepID=A0A061BJ45_RHOTO|nr:RHTO0S15e03928g1_1 [Rhodotorula toruloides]
MSQPLLGPYATSSALSAKHYQLVTAVESAPDDEAVNGVLVDACRRIRDSWVKTAPTPTKASHDLVFLLYCRTQRRDPSLAPDEAALLEGEWALPTAVLLAGGGRLRERQIGYRACAELFPPAFHPLKLLLINTISHDVSVPPSDDDADKRWSMALRAVGSPNIVSPELLSAVQAQIFDLLAARTVAESIKRLALATALSVVQCAKDEKLDGASALTAQTRARVLSLLLPPPPSSASTSSRQHHSHHSPASVTLLAALSSAIAPSSPIHPILPSAKDRIQLHASLLDRVLDTLDINDTSRSVWAVERALRNLAAELERLDAAEADAVDAPMELLWRAVDRLRRIGTALAEGAIVSALRLLPFFRDSVSTSPNTFDELLSRIQVRLVRPESSAQLLFALQSLALLPPSRWTTPPSDSIPLRRSTWGEREWAAILASLDSPDSTVRLSGLALVRRVDPNLVKLHYERLLSSLTSDDTHASATSFGSGASRKKRRGWIKQRDEVVERVLEILPFSPDSTTGRTASPSSPKSPRLPSASSLLALLSRPELDIPPTLPLPSLVLPVLSFFRDAPPSQQLFFAQQLVFDAEEQWKKSLIAGLWVAGTAHVLRDEEAERAAESLLAWLIDSSADLALVELLQEPLLFLVLRLIALNPSCTFLRVQNAIFRAEPSFASSKTHHLVAKLETALRDSEERQALIKAGTATADRSLADFSARIIPTPPIESSPSYTESHASSPALSSHRSRLFHPPSAPTPSSAPSSPLTTTDQVSSPRAPRSARALERERADLRRERGDRGGRGSGSRMVQSLMEREALSLEHDERGQGEGAEDERTSSKNALEWQSLSSGVGLETGAGDSQREERETSGEPPDDLLIELETLDPFRRA